MGDQAIVLAWSAEIVTPLRWFALAGGVLVCAMSIRGFLEFTRRQTVVNGFRALAFLVGAVAASYQSGVLLEGLPATPASPRSLFSLALLISAQVLAGGGVWLFRKIRTKNVSDLYDAIEATGPIADLYLVDREEALKLAELAREATVKAMLRKRT